MQFKDSKDKKIERIVKDSAFILGRTNFYQGEIETLLKFIPWDKTVIYFLPFLENLCLDPYLVPRTANTDNHHNYHGFYLHVHLLTYSSSSWL